MKAFDFTIPDGYSAMAAVVVSALHMIGLSYTMVVTNLGTTFLIQVDETYKVPDRLLWVGKKGEVRLRLGRRKGKWLLQMRAPYVDREYEIS